MSEEALAPVAEAATSYALPVDAPAQMSVSEAARLLSQARRKQEAPPAESAEPATADEPELAQANAAQPEADPSEIAPEADDPEEALPPIERPRSWAKELDEEWSSYPRAAQEKIAKREQERDAATRRSQNEAAEARKALEAQLAQAEQIRKEYETKLPALSKTLESALQSEFMDIKSFDDLRKMQAEDPFRYQQWDLRQKELAAVKQEEQAAEQRQRNERQSNWAKFVHEESKAFADEEPEFAAKQTEYTTKAKALFGELGFSEDELGKLASGEEKISLYDRRLQKLLFRAIKLDEIKAAPAKAIPKAVPPVQRPGTAQARAPSTVQQIQNLEKQLETARGNKALRIAADLSALRRAAR